jgi:hypothetical protein
VFLPNEARHRIRARSIDPSAARQNEHVGWDLEAEYNGTLLKLEVKGIAANQTVCELSANEFSSMKKYRKDYRICIVTNALKKRPTLSIYRYVPETKLWEHHADGTLLAIKPVWVQTARLFTAS